MNGAHKDFFSFSRDYWNKYKCAGWNNQLFQYGFPSCATKSVEIDMEVMPYYLVGKTNKSPKYLTLICKLNDINIYTKFL
jgi:hypothetical protein